MKMELLTKIRHTINLYKLELEDYTLKRYLLNTWYSWNRRRLPKRVHKPLNKIIKRFNDGFPIECTAYVETKDGKRFRAECFSDILNSPSIDSKLVLIPQNEDDEKR